MPSGTPDPTKLHPLSSKAIVILRGIAALPIQTWTINPGVRERLTRGGLVEEVRLPSRIKAHKGDLVAHLKITAAGILAIEKWEQTYAKR